MDRKDKVKKWIKDHKEPLINGAFAATISIVTYTFVCGKMGYCMNKPDHYDDQFFYVKTITGKVMGAKRLDV